MNNYNITLKGIVSWERGFENKSTFNMPFLTCANACEDQTTRRGFSKEKRPSGFVAGSYV